MWGPKVGEPYAFLPSMTRFNIPPPGDRQKKTKADRDAQDIVVGKITYVNQAHRYFLVVAEAGGAKLKESFKF